MSRPLLAICIPTWNRAPQLERLLTRLGEELGDDRDIVVSVADNASDDATPRLLERMAQRLPTLRWHRQSANLGAEGNIRWLIHEAPECEYLWCIGDDDEPEPGAIAEIAALLRAHRPAWLHLPHRFVHPDGRVKVESRRPERPEEHAGPGGLFVAQHHWLTFMSASIVRRDPLRRAVAASTTTNMYFPLIWFCEASLDGPCVVADRVLVSGSTDIHWGDRMVETMTHHFVGIYDEALASLVSAEEFGRAMDEHYTRDHFWCWQAAPVEFLIETVRRFPHSRVLRQYLWAIGRELHDPACAAEVAAAARAAGDDVAAQALVDEGESLFGSGDAAGAAGLFTRAIEWAPALATAWNDLAVALHALGRHGAREAVATALELDPADENTRQNHAAIMAPG
jgi:glycosyltransferase involved in cell wall biosynthesis